MELHQVRYFLAVCETRNFTRAAARCHVSQPALTTAIRKLEEELGGALFHRERSRIQLTTMGESLRPHFEQLAHGVNAVRTTADNHLRLRDVPLRIGVLVTIGPGGLAPLLSAFHAEERGVDVELHPGSASNLRDRLDHGALDVTITNLDDTEPGEDVEIHPLYTERYRVLLPPGHRFRTRTAIALADLSGEPYVDRLACELRDRVVETCLRRDIELYAALRSEREDWIQALVREGLGFAFMPEYSITGRDALSRPLVDPEVTRDISLVVPAHRSRSRAAQAFLATARAWAALRDASGSLEGAASKAVLPTPSRI